ncbi:MAG TPA: tyrosine-type recombinase/integrase [Verrucomicrobiae bacterium]|nr:tyrosine-type recombinase/integrase [Verrucomicrobiae bacterium]
MHLARRWLHKWENDRYNEKIGITVRPATHKDSTLVVDTAIDQYLEAGCPIIKKRALRPKAQRTIRGEKYCFGPLRAYFGKIRAAQITLADCDRYLGWRTAGGYVARFTVRGKAVVKKTRGGTRAVDMELTVLSNALKLAVRRNQLNTNPISGRGSYTDKATIVHCREKAPTPSELMRIRNWMNENGYQQKSAFTAFLGFSGLRIGEAREVRWSNIKWNEMVIAVTRSKKGILPWVPILPEMEKLLHHMQKQATSDLLFPAPFNSSKPMDDSAYRRVLKRACKKLGIRHATPHGLRSYFVTRAREAGFSDADIAQLIGDKTGPPIIAEVYGDVLPEHLLQLAQRIRKKSAYRLKHEQAQEPAPQGADPEDLTVTG